MKKVKAIPLTALLAGTLDGLAASIHYILNDGSNPLNVFRFVASGVFGNTALTGELGMALLGILFHYIIASIWVCLFFWLYPRVKPIWANKYISGIVYGIIVWLLMNLIVVPLSNTPPLSSSLLQYFIGMLIIIIAIGLPISIVYDKTVLTSEMV